MEYIDTLKFKNLSLNILNKEFKEKVKPVTDRFFEAWKEFEFEQIIAGKENVSLFNNRNLKNTHNWPVKAIIVIGCGGTGSWLIPKLVKTINDMKRKNLITKDFTLALVDGDVIEHKNLIRQNFIEQDIGKNKAAVMADRYSPHLNEGISTVYLDKYLTKIKENLEGKDKDNFVNTDSFLSDFTEENTATIIFNLVDNDNARKSLHCSASYLSNRSNIIIADVGNEDTFGQLYASFYNKFYNFFEDNFFDWNTEAWGNDEEVKIYSCAEADVDEAKQDQFLVANDSAATLAHNWLCSFMEHRREWPKYISFTSIPMPHITVYETTKPYDLNYFLNDIIAGIPHSNGSLNLTILKETIERAISYRNHSLTDEGIEFAKMLSKDKKFRACLVNTFS